MAFNGWFKCTLKAGESGRWIVDRGGDMGANLIGAHPESGFNLELIASEQTKVLEASFGKGEYQHYTYRVTITCRKLRETAAGNPPNPADDVAVFSLQGGGLV